MARVARPDRRLLRWTIDRIVGIDLSASHSTPQLMKAPRGSSCPVLESRSPTSASSRRKGTFAKSTDRPRPRLPPRKPRPRLIAGRSRPLPIRRLLQQLRRARSLEPEEAGPNRSLRMIDRRRRQHAWISLPSTISCRLWRSLPLSISVKSKRQEAVRRRIFAWHGSISICLPFSSERPPEI